MNVATMMMGEKGKMPLENLEARVDQLQESVDGLDRSLATSQQRRSELAAEREALILPARLRKDAGAQKRLGAIDTELERIKHDVSDDGDAKAELARQLAFAKNELALAKWESRRAEIRELLERRLEGKTARNLEKLANNLATALKTAADEDEQAFADIVAFEPGLRSDARPLQGLRELRGRIILQSFGDLLPNEVHWMQRQLLKDKNIAEEESRAYGRIRLTLDCLELVF
jgi:hypothetical protein